MNGQRKHFQTDTKQTYFVVGLPWTEKRPWPTLLHKILHISAGQEIFHTLQSQMFITMLTNIVHYIWDT